MTAPSRWDLAKLDLGPVIVFIAGILVGLFGAGWGSLLCL
jgi:hypothetical protein